MRDFFLEYDWLDGPTTLDAVEALLGFLERCGELDSNRIGRRTLKLLAKELNSHPSDLINAWLNAIYDESF